MSLADCNWIFGIILLCVILLGSSVFAFEDGIIESATEYDYPPLSVVTEDGKADGFSVELLRAALKTKNLEVTFYVGPWSEIKQDLEDGKIQVLPLVGRTPEREPIYDFTKPYLTFYGTIFVRKGDTSIKTVSDLADKEVLVMKEDNAEEYAIREAISQKLIAVENYNEAFQLLSDGQHDAVVVHQLVGTQIIKKLGIENVVAVDHRLEGFKQDFTFAVKKGDEGLLKILDEGLEIVKYDGTFERLQKKWFQEKSEDALSNNLLIIGATAISILLLVSFIVYVKKMG